MFVFSFLISPLSKGHLYLDPGTGSYLIQLLLATLLGGLYAVKVYWKSIRAFFTRGSKLKHPDTDATQPPDSDKDEPRL